MGFVLTRKESEEGREETSQIARSLYRHRLTSPPVNGVSPSVTDTHGSDGKDKFKLDLHTLNRTHCMHEVAATCSVRPRQSKGTDTLRHLGTIHK